MTEYRRLLYEFFKQRRRRKLILSGTILQKVVQLLNVLDPYIIKFIQLNNKWVLIARGDNDKVVTLVNDTRIACLQDLATIHEYEIQ